MDSAAGFTEGPARLAFWDSTGLFLVVAVQLLVLGVAVIRERRRRREREFLAAAGQDLVQASTELG
jgi:hypothetical protein